MRNKKGSLNLSIEAIVVIVIAFTVLGLGLTFVRNLLTDITEGSESVLKETQDKILDDLRIANKKLSFPSDEVKLNKGASKQLAIGVKDTDETPLKFRIKIKMIDTGEEVTNKGLIKDADNFDVGKFIWNPSIQTLEPTESNVYPIKFIAGKHADTYTFVIMIEREDGTEYASKSFFITIL